MTEAQRVTISVSIPSILHLILGIILTVITAAAFVIHLDLPRESIYRPTVASAGVVAAFATMSYWLWCCIQRSRAEASDLHDAVVAAAAAAKENEEASKARDEAMLAVLNGIAATLAEIAGGIANNEGGVKELARTMDGYTGTMAAVQSAVNATAANVKVLQDLYLKEGRVLVFPEDAPRDIALPQRKEPKARTEIGPGRSVASERTYKQNLTMYTPSHR